MLKKVLIGLAAVIVVLCGVVALQPADFSISRSVVIAAAPGDVFVYVNDLRRWEDWSPWAKIDAAMTSTYEGPDQGVGASHTWASDQVGEGKMTIVESVPDEKVIIRLDFMKPMAATNTAAFLVAAEGAGTKVSWTMSGKNGFLAKAMNLVMDMDKMLGAQFEQGLNQLKMNVESGRT